MLATIVNIEIFGVIFK